MWQIYAAVATVLAMILAAMRLFGGGKGAVAEATRNDDVGTGELPRRLREEAVRPGRARGNPQGVAAAAEESDSEGEGGAVAEDDEIDYTKMGKKKAMKMQAKAERKAAHEAMLAQQEDRRAREELREEERKTREAEEAAEAAREAEEERKRLEEIARQEEELYQSLKGEFSVEESGTIEDENTEEKLEQFIEYVESEKVRKKKQCAPREMIVFFRWCTSSNWRRNFV